MGSRKYTLLTPYLIVEGTKVVEIPRVNRICKEHPKIKQPINKFCSECGGEIVGVDYIEKQYLKPLQVLYNYHGYDDKLCSVEYLDGILIPNKHVPDSLSIDSDTDGYMNLSSPERRETIDKQIKWFITEYSKEIAYLQQEFGGEHVIVNWGLVTYWS